MRYFFHLRNDDRILEDLEGADFDCLDDVRREAVAGAREMIAERIKVGMPVEIGTGFEIRDENGALVHTLPFAAVLLASLSSGGGAF